MKVKYKGETSFLIATKGRIYDVLSVEKGWYRIVDDGTVKYYAQIHLQVWQNSVCTGQGNLPLIT